MSNRWIVPDSMHSFSFQNSRGYYNPSSSDSGSETSFEPGTDDEASILYSMQKRPCKGLKRLCEVPLDEEEEYQQYRVQAPNSEPDPDFDYIEVIMKETTAKKEVFILSNGKKKVPSDSCKTKMIAFTLLVTIGLTVALVILLVNHARKDKRMTQPVESDLAFMSQEAASPETTTINSTSQMQSSTSTTNSPTAMPMTTMIPSQFPSPESTGTWSYILDYLSSHTKREYLLDPSRPQGRAFLQLVLDNDSSFASLSRVKLLQTYAVLTLYFSTSPKLWDSAYAWTYTTSNVCAWDGVIQCNELTNGEQVVEAITISNLGLSGVVPEEICLLEHLERLDLRSNELTGSIPNCLVGSSSLKILFLGNNSLTGYLPPGMLLVPTLEEFEISNNSLVGGLDMLVEGGFVKNIYRYGDSWRLRRLNVENNLLSGTVPAFFGALGRLTSLTLHGNEFKGEIDESLCSRAGISLKELTADCRRVDCRCCTSCY